MPGSLTTCWIPMGQRIAMLDTACLAAGRDPAAVRGSVWGGPAVLADEAAYAAFARRHLELGLTDISAVPRGVPAERLRRIATEVVPRLRAEFAPGA